MNIVIVGAGTIGRYIAAIFSKENHNVILVDKDEKKLEEASWQMDVATKKGSGTDWQVLDQLLDLSPDLFVALTNDDQTNLVSCNLAKNLGYPRTIARVKDDRFLNRTRLDFGRIFDVDHFIGPELLVANEIYKYMISPGSLRVETFVHGAVQLRTIVVPSKWRRSGRPLSQLDLPLGIMVALIRRPLVSMHEHKANGKEIIFPHGSDFILPGDEVTLIGETEAVTEAHQFFGLAQETVKSALIIGGSRTAINLAKILEPRPIDVRVIEKDYQKCCLLAELLPRTTVINHDASDLNVLREEKVNLSDVFVTCTRSDEINVMMSLLGKEVGCRNIVVQLSNPGYVPMMNRLDINHTVSPRIIAANRILALALSGTVTSVTSLYEGQAEVMEINVSTKSKIAGIPIAELGNLFPRDFLIAIIQNRGRVMIAHGNRVISPGDRVIAISNPTHLYELEKIF